MSFDEAEHHGTIQTSDVDPDQYAYDAKALFDAMKGTGCKEDEVVDVLCARSNTQVRKNNQNYNVSRNLTIQTEFSAIPHKSGTSGMRSL